MTSNIQAEEVVGSDYRDGIIESVGAEPEMKIPVPTPRPDPPPGVAPPRVREEADPVTPPGTSNANFSRVKSSVTSSPIWPAFADLFQKCAPSSCTAPGVINSFRRLPRGQTTHSSCHHSSRAIDLTSIICNGRSKNAYSSEFLAFVNCAKSASYNGKAWKYLFRETHKGSTRDCTQSTRNVTDCHWDHIHLSFGCPARGI